MKIKQKKKHCLQSVMSLNIIRLLTTRPSVKEKTIITRRHEILNKIQTLKVLKIAICQENQTYLNVMKNFQVTSQIKIHSNIVKCFYRYLYMNKTELLSDLKQVTVIVIQKNTKQRRKRNEGKRRRRCLMRRWINLKHTKII